MNNTTFLFTACLLAFSLGSCDQKKPPEESGSNPPSCEVTLHQLLEVDTLVGVMQKLSPWEEIDMEAIDNLNESIATELRELLSCPLSEGLDMNNIFENLGYSQTPDGRIRNFNWYANNGGTWQETRRIYQYAPNPDTVKTTPVDILAGASHFYQLKKDPPLYLGTGGDKTCSTCLLDYAELFSFRADTLHVEDVLTVEYRMGNLLVFEFDTTSQVFHFSMVVDDLNEEWASDFPSYRFGDLNIELGEEYEGWEPEANARVVVDSLVFDGTKFIRR